MDAPILFFVAFAQLTVHVLDFLMENCCHSVHGLPHDSLPQSLRLPLSALALRGHFFSYSTMSSNGKLRH